MNRGVLKGSEDTILKSCFCRRTSLKLHVTLGLGNDHLEDTGRAAIFVH